MKVQLEVLLSQLGNPGRYQVFIFLLLCLNYFPLVFNHVIMAFFGSRPKHQCYSSAYLPGTVQDSVTDFSMIQMNYTSLGNNATVTGQFESCSARYYDAGNQSMSIVCPDSEESFLIYQKSERESTIVTEWDLVCSQAYLSSLATTIYFCGVMVGGVVFGHLADKFGRKPVMLISLFMPIVVGIATSFAPWYSVFVTLRFIQGVLMQGLQTSTYTLAMELFLPQHRSYAGAILECFWGLTVMTVPLLAYLIPNWRHLQLVVSLPSLLAVFYICFMPESLRWLILKNRVEKAEAQISKITAWNKQAFPHHAWEDVKLQLGTMAQDTKQYSMLDLLKTPNLRKRSLVLFYLWFAISIGYYGLTWRLTSLPGNKYLNFFIAGCVEFVAYTLVIYITKRFGRKKPLLTYFMLASLFMIGAGVVPLALKNVSVYVTSGLAIAGKFAMGGLFSVIFLYTSELYPTIVRNIGMGSCAFWTRVGGVIAPQIIVLDHFSNKSMPLILFGLVTLIGGFLTILLPETLGRKLPDNIDDVEQSGSHDNIVNGEEMKSLNSNPDHDAKQENV
ncbi:organic cation transporter protein-like [Mercenaria mercenaria]|uniref:organic cation transporter protein-like n=1 Tax=Mercenaria mercenaria TaxID=6596 RepID=UPI00234F977A|nr:organic cation transporter protein-like [Mercenaria mercenaria]XP_053376202.1 organic cation transporter protein-like [Mercenaria mercenaria]XP_053376203.1 organic cation transporter protein-like [Mercenaria mercenaria]